MNTLKAEKRDLTVKAKKLRREGIVPGNLFGKDMKEAMALQFTQKDADRFMKENKKGSEVTLEIGDQKIDALVKDASFDPMKNQIMFLDFQALVAGEKVMATAQIELVNEDKYKGYAHLEVTELEYKADPAHLIEKVQIDMAKCEQGHNIRVSDLELNQDKNIHIITPADMLLVNVTEHMGVQTEETEADTEEAAQ